MPGVVTCSDAVENMFARSVAGVMTPPAASMVTALLAGVTMTAALLAGVTVARGRRDWCWGVAEVEEPGEGGVQGLERNKARRKSDERTSVLTSKGLTC